MESPGLPDTSGLPAYWELLDKADQMGYCELRKFIEPLTARASREKTAKQFRVILTEIRQYVVRNDGNDWKRSVICGIAWLADDIAISTRQLSKLIGKCKSSVNSGFQSLGYGTVPTNLEHAILLSKIFPFMMDNSIELRQWTVRAMSGDTPTIERGQNRAGPNTTKEELEVSSAESIPMWDSAFTDALEPSTLSVLLWGEEDLDEPCFWSS
jgi:hypothetical protein